MRESVAYGLTDASAALTHAPHASESARGQGDRRTRVTYIARNLAKWGGVRGIPWQSSEVPRDGVGAFGFAESQRMAHLPRGLGAAPPWNSSGGGRARVRDGEPRTILAARSKARGANESLPPCDARRMRGLARRADPLPRARVPPGHRGEGEHCRGQRSADSSTARIRLPCLPWPRQRPHLPGVRRGEPF